MANNNLKLEWQKDEAATVPLHRAFFADNSMLMLLEITYQSYCKIPWKISLLGDWKIFRIEEHPDNVDIVKEKAEQLLCELVNNISSMFSILKKETKEPCLKETFRQLAHNIG